VAEEEDANDVEDNESDEQSGEDIGVVLKPASLAFGCERVVLFWVLRVVTEGEFVVGLYLDGRVKDALVGDPVDLIREAYRVVGGFTDAGAAAVRGPDKLAVAHLGFYLRPVVMEYMFNQVCGHIGDFSKGWH
jgi:hypothetical protein